MHRYAALLLGIVAAATCDRAPAAQLPAAAAAALAELLRTCTDANGTPHYEHAAQQADLNGDGRPDVVLYAGWIVCENAWSVYGDREKAVQVFVSNGHGADEAFVDRVFDAQLQTDGKRARLVLTVSGPACGKPRTDSFSGESFCERTLVFDPATRHFGYGH
jgi:hypothetical protein